MNAVHVFCAAAVVCSACASPAPTRPNDGTVYLQSVSGLDGLTPIEVAAAANVLVLGSASSAGRISDGTHPLYDVTPRQVLFDVHGFANRPHLAVIGDDTLEIPVSDSVVLALTPAGATNAGRYRLTWRVLSIGTLGRDDLAYRGSGGRLFHYDVSRRSSDFGCFFAANANRSACRNALLRKVGVRTPAERAAYDMLLARSPFANLLWMLVRRRTPAEFPATLCSTTHDDCASEASFARRSHFHPLN